MADPRAEDIQQCRITIVNRAGKPKTSSFKGGVRGVRKATDFWQKKEYTESSAEGKYEVKVDGSWRVVRTFRNED